MRPCRDFIESKIFWRASSRWITKSSAFQYALTSLFFLLIGFSLAVLFRWQLAYPGQPVPIIGRWFGELNAPGGMMLPEFYNQLVAMHGTIMVFLAVVPLSVGAFGNYLIPLQIGAADMAFPRLNLASYWTYLAGGLVMLASFFVRGGAPNSGWTSYPPLADFATLGQTYWLVGMSLLSVSAVFGSVNTITTTAQLRAPGLTWFRLPFLCGRSWSRRSCCCWRFHHFKARPSCSLPIVCSAPASASGLFVGGQVVNRVGGGNPLLWQHLFWFLGHPEVYVLILPAMGMVSEIIANNTRKSLWGYRMMVYAIIFLGFMSFAVWAHHMFLTGMGTAIHE